MLNLVFFPRAKIPYLFQMLAAGAVLDDRHFRSVERCALLRTFFAIHRAGFTLAVSPNATGANRRNPPFHPQMRTLDRIRRARAAALARATAVKK